MNGTLPDFEFVYEFEDAARPITMMDVPDTVVTTPSRSGFPFWNISYIDMVIQSADPVLSAHKDKPSHWWYAQLTKFTLRPSDFTLHQLVWPLQLGAFYRTHGALPHPLAAVFIRAGDKFKEAPLLSVDAHFAELAPIAAKLGIKDVYLGSDSHDRIVEALGKYGSTYTIHFIDWARPEVGLAFEHVTGSQNSWRMNELVRLARADMYISA